MTTEERVNAFYNLGNYLSTIDTIALSSLIEQAKTQNSWFTEKNITIALRGLVQYLDIDRLTRWTSAYAIQSETQKKVAVVMAGNIPFVGLHDVLSVLISGHQALIKLSSKDSVLIPYLLARLCELEPRFNDRIHYVERLKEFDAVIATGSDNSSRYFDYYFAKYPNIIRRNRTSCAVLLGNETRDELCHLGDDVFTHFGLGCRNVSKVYVPSGYDFVRLIESWDDFKDILNHHKYHNNYDYQKSIMLVNRVPFLDNGFVMFTENNKLVSPISVVFYEYYSSLDSLKEKLTVYQDKIQCIVGKSAQATVSFGQAQYPELWDYADQIDTLKFLTALR